jgi:hypothetical protein
MAVPTGLAGTITIVSLVALGIFVYPWLLRKRGGAIGVAVITAALAGLFYLFDRPSGAATATSAGLALLWALAPVATGLLVWRLQRRRATGN